MKDDNINDLKKNAKDLEDILFSMDVDAPISSGDQVFPKMKVSGFLDYEKVKKEADERAANVVESVITMYLPIELIKQQNYIFQKMEVDKLTVSNLLFQMKTAEHALRKLLEEIDNGSVGPRSFEVLSSLQRSKMEIIKHLQAFMITMENNYKNIKFDFYGNNLEKKAELLPLDNDEEIVDIENTKKFRGTKDLMSIVQSYVGQNKQKQDEQSVSKSEPDSVSGFDTEE